MELGFISNAKEAELLKNENFLDRAAKCIAKGVCKYFNVAYKEDNEIEKVKRNYKYKNTTKSFDIINLDENNYIAVRDLTELLGKKVSYDNVTKFTVIED